MLLFNVLNPETFKANTNVVLLFNVEEPETVYLIICNDKKAVDPFIYPKRLVVVLFKVLINNVDELDNFHTSLLVLSVFVIKLATIPLVIPVIYITLKHHLLPLLLYVLFGQVQDHVQQIQLH